QPIANLGIRCEQQNLAAIDEFDGKDQASVVRCAVKLERKLGRRAEPVRIDATPRLIGQEAIRVSPEIKLVIERGQKVRRVYRFGWIKSLQGPPILLVKRVTAIAIAINSLRCGGRREEQRCGSVVGELAIDFASRVCLVQRRFVVRRPKDEDAYARHSCKCSRWIGRQAVAYSLRKATSERERACASCLCRLWRRRRKSSKPRSRRQQCFLLRQMRHWQPWPTQTRPTSARV